MKGLTCIQGSGVLQKRKGVDVSAGVTTGPGRGAADYERMQRRHSRASVTMLHTLASAHAWHRPAVCPPARSARAFTKRVEVCEQPL